MKLFEHADFGQAIIRAAEHFRPRGAAVTDLTASQRRQSGLLAKRKTELVNMQDRLLNAYLSGTVEEEAYKAKSNELKAEGAKVEESLAKNGDTSSGRADAALALFDWTQQAAEMWRGSNNAVRSNPATVLRIADCGNLPT